MSESAEHRSVRLSRLRKWLITTAFVDLYQGLNAYAELCDPQTAVKLIGLLQQLRKVRSDFERYTREKP